MPRVRGLLLAVFLSTAIVPTTVGDSAQGSDECTISPDHWASPASRWQEITRTTESVSRELPTSRLRPVHREPAVIPARNFIDTAIMSAMRDAGVETTRLTSDEEFLRRVSLDLTGALPTPDQVRIFVADSSPDKRASAIDLLLESEGYVDRWTLWFGDLVQNVRFATNSILANEGRNAYYLWIRDSFERNKPYDQMVRELIAASGDNFTSGPANYIVRQRQPNGPPQDTYDNLAASSMQKFMAMPFECISCHTGPGHLELVNSYMASRERSEFWSMAAFFARTGARPIRDDETTRIHFTISERPFGEYELNTMTGNKSPREPAPGGSEFAEPRFFFGGGTPVPFETRREESTRPRSTVQTDMPSTADHLADLTFVRSGLAWAAVHSLAQTWAQISRNPSGALGKIAPHIGAVVALETQLQRGPDDVLPGFIALNSGNIIGSGYLPADYAPFSVNPTSAGLTALSHPDGTERLEERWEMITTQHPDRDDGALGKPSLDMHGFYGQAKTLID